MAGSDKDMNLHAPHIKWDGTVNIPTILTLLLMAASVVAFGIRTYNDLSHRIDANTSDIKVLRTTQQQQAATASQLRSDMKDDLHDINAKLDKLLWDRGDQARATPNPKLRGWTK